MGRLLHLAEVPEIAIDAGRWQPLNKSLGIRTFGVNAVAMDPDDGSDIEHDEAGSGHQEVYVVVTGRAAFRLGDEEVEAGPGDVVAADDPGGDARLPRDRAGDADPVLRRRARSRARLRPLDRRRGRAAERVGARTLGRIGGRERG